MTGAPPLVSNACTWCAVGPLPAAAATRTCALDAAAASFCCASASCASSAATRCLAALSSLVRCSLMSRSVERWRSTSVVSLKFSAPSSSRVAASLPTGGAEGSVGADKVVVWSGVLPPPCSRRARHAAPLRLLARRGRLQLLGRQPGQQLVLLLLRRHIGLGLLLGSGRLGGHRGPTWRGFGGWEGSSRGWRAVASGGAATHNKEPHWSPSAPGSLSGMFSQPNPPAGAARPWTLSLLCKAELLTAEPSNRRHLTQARPLRHPSDVCVEPRHGRLAGGLSTRLSTGFVGRGPAPEAVESGST